jgi:hypothetical protein
MIENVDALLKEADMDFTNIGVMIVYLRDIGVICKSPWIKVDMVALFLPQDVAQL